MILPLILPCFIIFFQIPNAQFHFSYCVFRLYGYFCIVTYCFFLYRSLTVLWFCIWKSLQWAKTVSSQSWNIIYEIWRFKNIFAEICSERKEKKINFCSYLNLRQINYSKPSIIRIPITRIVKNKVRYKKIKNHFYLRGIKKPYWNMCKLIEYCQHKTTISKKSRRYFALLLFLRMWPFILFHTVKILEGCTVFFLIAHSWNNLIFNI